MNLTEALQKNGGYANNRSIAPTIQVTGEWGYAAGEQGGSLVVYAVDAQGGESTRRYPEIGHVASLDDVGWYLGRIINIERTEQISPMPGSSVRSSASQGRCGVSRAISRAISRTPCPSLPFIAFARGSQCVE